MATKWFRTPSGNLAKRGLGLGPGIFSSSSGVVPLPFLPLLSKRPGRKPDFTWRLSIAVCGCLRRILSIRPRGRHTLNDGKRRLRVYGLNVLLFVPRHSLCPKAAAVGVMNIQCQPWVLHQPRRNASEEGMFRIKILYRHEDPERR